MAGVTDVWGGGIAAAIVHFRTGRFSRYSGAQYLAVIDDIADQGTCGMEWLAAKHGGPDLCATAIGHVSTRVHGGTRPKHGAWLETDARARRYCVDPGFAAAWRAARARS